MGAWGYVVHLLADRAGVDGPAVQVRRFLSVKSDGRGHHTVLCRRRDRTDAGGRLHFASAMTLLERVDGQGADEGVSYLELADLSMRLGA